MSKTSKLIRTLFLVVLLLVSLFLCILQLLRMQIVDGEAYLALTEASYSSTQLITATRGQIFDSKGSILTSNQTVYKAVMQKAYLSYSEQNDIILNAVEILKNSGDKWNDSVPVTYTVPFSFNTENEDVIERFKKAAGVNSDATADNCISSLAKKYNIDREKYTEEETRIICGVRYEMALKDFSFDNRFILSDDVSLESITSLKEKRFALGGIDIVEESKRNYVKSSVAPHILGTVGAISSEEYSALKEDGYGYNDIIGKYGIERAMESVLRGDNGQRTITRDSKGNAISDEITKEVIAGNSVKLTFDENKQNMLNEALANHVNWLNNSADRGNDCDAGAVVVLDAKTGAVLGMSSYPSYDLTESVENYASVLNSEGNPMFNRCINGLYRPGSAFKTITATDGLINGLIDRNTKCTCTGIYTYYAASDYQPKCTGYHLGYDVVNCLKWSCNIFFYDLGRRLGIDQLSDFAGKFGYGKDLGLEIGGLSGQMSSPELYEQLRGEPWTDGNTLQAAIGQMDTLVTPLHLAVQALTLANDGVRYKPYLVDSVWNYDMTEMIYSTSPQIEEVIENKNDAFGTVREGMIAVSTLVNWPTSSLLWNFEGLPYGVAIKTGTAETGDGYYTSTVMGYYPAENPEIAFGIIFEKGEYSRYMVRNIIDIYIYNKYEPDMDENGIVISPWKRWGTRDNITVGE